MSEVCNKILKFQWLCAVILIVFNIESYYEKELIKNCILKLVSNNMYIIVINRILTGVTVLSFLFISIKKIISVFSDNNSLAIIDVINYSITETVFIWIIMAKYAFTIIIWTISDISFFQSAISGWHNIYITPVMVSVILWCICIKKSII